MSIKKITTGTTGFVELDGTHAHKFIDIDSMTWIREYSIFLYLSKFPNDHVIALKSDKFTRKFHVGKKKLYLELVFDQHNRSLSDLHIADDRLLLQIFMDLVDAMYHLHSHNVMHRDIKPTNILIHKVDGEHRAVLIDFSHSLRLRTDAARLTSEMVTFPYRAPEIYRYNRSRGTDKLGYDFSIDIFSLGILLLEIIISRDKFVEFRGNEAATKVKYISGIYYEELDELLEGADFEYAGEYKKWIKMMLNPDSDARPTAGELYDMVSVFIKSEGLGVKCAGRKDIEEKECRNPIFGTCIDESVKEYTLVGDKMKLLHLCAELAEEYYDTCGMFFDPVVMKKIMGYMIYNDAINVWNYNSYIAAVCSLFDLVFYDSLTTLEDLAIITKLNEQHILACMIEIVTKYADLLL